MAHIDKIQDGTIVHVNVYNKRFDYNKIKDILNGTIVQVNVYNKMFDYLRCYYLPGDIVKERKLPPGHVEKRDKEYHKYMTDDLTTNYTTGE